MIGVLSRTLLASALHAEASVLSCASALGAAQQQLCRTSSSRAVGASPSPSHPSAEHVFAELNKMESYLRKTSQVNGSRRLELSLNVLPMPMPKHEVETGLMSIDIHVRPDTGSTISKWLRKVSRVPGRLMSLPGNKVLMVHMDSRDAEKLVRQYGLNGCQSRVVQLRLVDPSDAKKELAVVRAKPQEVRRNAASLAIENIDFMFCPQHRTVKVDVPIKLVNADASVGVKKGAWLMSPKRTVMYECKGSSIPPCIEIDVKGLDVDQAVRVKDLSVPEGTTLIHQDFDAVVVRCTTEISEEVAVK